MNFLAALLISIAALGFVASKSLIKCISSDIHRWPGRGYRASIMVVSPVMVRRSRRVILTLKFNNVVLRIENVHIRGGSIRFMGSTTTKKEMKLQFRTEKTIYRRQRVSLCNDFFDFCFCAALCLKDSFLAANIATPVNLSFPPLPFVNTYFNIFHDYLASLVRILNHVLLYRRYH